MVQAPVIADDRDERVRELVRLARLEREATGQRPPPDPVVRLSRLEHLRPPLRRTPVVAAEPSVAIDVDLTAKQRALLEVILVAPSVSAAAASLSMSRSNVYASLRRVGRKIGVTDVSELLRRLRAGRLTTVLDL
jgi:DNA-binding NarL/FixJ family response regulator